MKNNPILLQTKYGGITPRARTGTAGVLGCWCEQLGRKSAGQGNGLSGATAGDPWHLQQLQPPLVAVPGKHSDFQTFSGICARKLGCVTFGAKFGITSISHSPSTFYDNISKPFMSISYSSLSSFEIEKPLCWQQTEP